MSIRKITWLTDIHLNFLESNERSLFYQKIIELNTNAILITGDIAEARSVCNILIEMNKFTNMPIYFVLGNHDYYSGNIAGVRTAVTDLCLQHHNIHWLGKPEIIQLNKDTVLLGHDGWADARYGDYDHSAINLNDSRLIAELFQASVMSRQQLKKAMQEFADNDASVLRKTLINALEFDATKIIVATHVPPFVESCWHIDRPSDKDWLPFFSSKVTGDVISDFAIEHPEINLLVLCGHTHTASTYKPFDNLEVKAGSAKYYQPIIQDIIKV